jgi:oxygen-independent coproporphyrinogen-3 oxidase
LTVIAGPDDAHGAHSVDSTSYHHCYVHVPFCARRCSYCDFAISVRKTVPVADYVRGIARELQQRGFGAHSLALDTLYFGGGTPSALGADGVRELLGVMRSVATLAADVEVTLEANPEDVSLQSVTAWRAAGINRLSIGIQSFDDSVLKWMHRVHDSAAAEAAVRTAREAGVSALSLDLIFALPSVLGRDWANDLERALALEPDHISLYGLTIEPRTPLGRWTADGTVAEAPEEGYEEQFLLARRLLGEAGYEHYEVSNFAKPGKRAVHNSAYWSGAPYLGVGPSAHGFNGTVRRWNVAPYSGWLKKVGDDADPVAGSETLTASERVTEGVYLGLRTRDGLHIGHDDLPLVSRWVSAGWLEYPDAGDAFRVRCTPEGWLRLDGLAADLTALRSH